MLAESDCTAQGFDSTKIVKEGYSRYNLSLGVGLTEVAGKGVQDWTPGQQR